MDDCLACDYQWNASENRHDVERYHAFIGCDGGALDALQEFQGVGEAVFRVSSDLRWLNMHLDNLYVGESTSETIIHSGLPD